MKMNKAAKFIGAFMSAENLKSVFILSQVLLAG